MFSCLLINSSRNGIFLRWSAADLMCWIDHQLVGQDCSDPALQGKAEQDEEFRERGGWRIGNTPHIWTPLPILPLTQPNDSTDILIRF